MDAVAQLISEEGFAAITSRRIAEKAGLKHQLIYYYFDTLDDLYLAVFRRGAEQSLARLAKAMDSDQPLRVLWKVSSDPRTTKFTAEYMALAHHNEAIRAEIARHVEEYRKLQIEALSKHLRARGFEPRLSPALLTLLMNAVGSMLLTEEALGIRIGHADAEAFVEAFLRQFEQTGGAAPAAMLVDQMVRLESN